MKTAAIVLGIKFSLLIACVSAHADEPWRYPWKHSDAARLLGIAYAGGAFEELKGVWHLRPSDKLLFDNDDSRQYSSYALLSNNGKVIYTSPYFRSGHGGDSSMQILWMIRNDRKMIENKLNKADARDLTHFCQFAGVPPAAFVHNANQFLAIGIKLPNSASTYHADFSNTYIDKEIIIPDRRAFIVYGFGLGYGYAYWLNKAIGGKSPREMVTLDSYFEKEYKLLNGDERACLAIQLLANPLFNGKRDFSLRALFQNDAPRIRAKVRRFNQASLERYCRWTGIKKSQFMENLRGIR